MASGRAAGRRAPPFIGAIAESVRAALADALRAERAPSDLRFASNDERPRA